MAELHRVAADGPARPVDQERLSGGEPGVLE
jgi:hypothetical protein